MTVNKANSKDFDYFLIFPFYSHHTIPWKRTSILMWNVSAWSSRGNCCTRVSQHNGSFSKSLFLTCYINLGWMHQERKALKKWRIKKKKTFFKWIHKETKINTRTHMHILTLRDTHISLVFPAHTRTHTHAHRGTHRQKHVHTAGRGCAEGVVQRRVY